MGADAFEDPFCLLEELSSGNGPCGNVETPIDLSGPLELTMPAEFISHEGLDVRMDVRKAMFDNSNFAPLMPAEVKREPEIKEEEVDERSSEIKDMPPMSPPPPPTAVAEAAEAPEEPTTLPVLPIAGAPKR